jgi:acetyl-CoA C-acetyltransferase
MGESAEWIARSFDVSRAAQDAFAHQSHARAIAAQDAGLFAEEIVPVAAPAGRGKTVTISADEPPRRDSDAKSLAGLRPAFAADGTVTAGNAPGITDGAAALVVTSAQAAQQMGLRPLARIIGSAQAAVKPLELFTAPVFAVRRLMERTSTSLDSYDLFEINEAFAAQVVATGRELGIDWDRLNVNGGAIALGHPIGASGARVLVTLLHALKRRGETLGVAALCLGGGNAVATVVERLADG